MNITDKVLFTQGNVSTYASGTDGRLMYNGIDGVDKKYVLKDELPIVPKLSIDADGDAGIHYSYEEQIHKRELKIEFLHSDDTEELICQLVSICEVSNHTTGAPDEEIKEIIWQAKLSYEGEPSFTTINDESGEPINENEQNND